MQKQTVDNGQTVNILIILSEGLSERNLIASNTNKRFGVPWDSAEAGAVYSVLYLCTISAVSSGYNNTRPTQM